MKTLGSWIRERPLPPHDAMGWVLRVARGLMPLHALDVPHGRVTAEAVLCAAPPCAARGMLLDADEVRRSYDYYSAMRCKISGSSAEDDVWALGVLLYHGVTGAFPFPGKHRRAVRERIEWRPASPIAVYAVEHPRLQSLLDRLFKPEEVLRLVTVDQLIDALLAIDPSLADLPPLEFGVVTGEEVSAVQREPARSAARAAELERTVERVRRELDADEEARVLERLVDRMARERKASAPEEPLAGDRASDDAIVLDAADIDPLSDEEAPAELPSIHRATPEPATRQPHRLSVWSEGAGSGRYAQPLSRRRTDRGQSTFWRLAGIGAATALVAIGTYFAFSRRAPPPAAPSGRRAVPSAAAARSALPPAASAAPVEDLTACVAGLLDPGTFEASTPRLDFICSEPNARRAADALETEIVLGKGSRAITQAMQRWSQLGWYELAVVSTARAQCCATPAAFATTLGGAPCFYDRALSELGAMAVRGDARAFDRAMGDYAKAVACLVRGRSERFYGQSGPPSEREAGAFEQWVRTVRAHNRSGG